MARRDRQVWGCLLLAGMVLTPGCGQGNQATVTGTVTLNGKALDRGTVTFLPVAQGPIAYGQIGQDGSYSLQTGARAGLVAGKYVVTVVATTEAPDPNSGTVGKLLTPPKYGDAKLTDLQFEVKSGANRLDLPLKGSPP